MKIESTPWYALFVITGQEEKTKVAIEATFKDIKAIVPTRELRERKSGKWEIVKRKLFPGYVLLKGKISVEDYYKMKTLPVATNFLKDEDGLLEIDKRELRALNILLREDENVGISTAYKIDEKIKITQGPLAGFEANIESIDARKGRAKVKMDFLGETRIVQLGIDFIDKI